MIDEKCYDALGMEIKIGAIVAHAAHLSSGGLSLYRVLSIESESRTLQSGTAWVSHRIKGLGGKFRLDRLCLNGKVSLLSTPERMIVLEGKGLLSAKKILEEAF